MSSSSTEKRSQLFYHSKSPSYPDETTVGVSNFKDGEGTTRAQILDDVIEPSSKDA